MLPLSQKLLAAAGFEYDAMEQTWVVPVPLPPLVTVECYDGDDSHGCTLGGSCGLGRQRLHLFQLFDQRPLCLHRRFDHRTGGGSGLADTSQGHALTSGANAVFSLHNEW